MFTTLGKTGLKVSRLGYGSMGLRGPRTWGVRVVSDPDAERILNAVLDAGINLIDTSPDYGLSEERIGKYIGHRRDEYFLATKCGCVYTQREDHLELDHVWDEKVIRGNLETSLRRLQTDHIDLLQFHGGDAETLTRGGLIELLGDFRRSGLVRHIGISTSLPKVADLIELDAFETFQLPYSVLAPGHEPWIERAAAKGAGIIIRGGIAQGGPEAEIQRPQLNDVWQAAGLADFLAPSQSPADLILRCTLSNLACHTVIVGTCNPQHLAENVAALRAGPLPLTIVKQINARIARVADN
ncbi:MAG: aldo/keto reductase [Planctomycetaceae bacterium]|nr:MAG: aldo/keto reductase [Planctomycetaceae bacterium]